MNKCLFYGRLTNDVDIRYNDKTQKAIAKFSIAVNRDFKNKEGKYDADFFTCVAFDKRAEIIGNYFNKGSRICVWGAMRQEHWEDKDGNKRTGYSLMVEGFNFVDAAPAKNRAEAAAERVASSFDKYGEDLGDF
jgi:single-strand DNA-binding protein